MSRARGASGSAQLQTRARSKRARLHREEEARADARECPVCLNDYEGMGAHTEAWPFVCAHSICTSCNQQMFTRWDDRCPCCRSDRRDDLPEPCSRGRRPGGAAGGGATTIFFPVQSPISMPSELMDILVASHLSQRSGRSPTVVGVFAPRAAEPAEPADGGDAAAEDHSIEAQEEAAWRLSQHVIDHLQNPDVMHLISGLVDPTSASVGEFLERAQRGRARPVSDV